MKRKYFVRAVDLYIPGTKIVHLFDMVDKLDASLVVPEKELVDFPLRGIVEVETSVVEVQKDTQKPELKRNAQVVKE